MNDVPRCKICVLSRWNRVSKKKRWTSIWPKYMKTSRAASFCVLPCPGFGTAVFPSHVIQSEESVGFWLVYIYISIYVCFVPFSLIWFPTEMLRTTANSRLFDPHTLTGSMYDIWYTYIFIFSYIYIYTYIDLPFKNQKCLKDQPCHVGKICHGLHGFSMTISRWGSRVPVVWRPYVSCASHVSWRPGPGHVDRTSDFEGCLVAGTRELPGWSKQAMLHSGYGNR